MGFSPAFLSALKSKDAKVIAEGVAASSSSGKYMTEGDHDIRIVAVDRNNLDTGKLIVRYANAAGAEFDDYLYTENTNRKTGEVEIGWGFAQMLSMLLPDPAAITVLFEHAAANKPEVLDFLIGMQGAVTLGRKVGYGPVETTQAGGSMVRCVKTKEVLGIGDTPEQAQAAAEAQGYKKAFLKVVKYKATNGDANVAAFEKSLVAITKPKAVVSVAAFGQKR